VEGELTKRNQMERFRKKLPKRDVEKRRDEKSKLPIVRVGQGGVGPA